jgi:hypothetical protein
VLLHRLALALGKTVAELEISMSMRELIDWERYEALHAPLPDRLIDSHFAVLCSLVVNIVRGSDSAPVPAADFLQARRQTPPAADGLDEIDEVDRQRIAWRGG